MHKRKIQDCNPQPKCIPPQPFFKIYDFNNRQDYGKEGSETSHSPSECCLSWEIVPVAISFVRATWYIRHRLALCCIQKGLGYRFVLEFSLFDLSNLFDSPILMNLLRFSFFWALDVTSLFFQLCKGEVRNISLLFFYRQLYSSPATL